MNSRGARKKQDKDWEEGTLKADRYYIHCTSVGPNVILKGGLDPSYGKEDITLKGQGPPGKYILAFPAPGNEVPDQFQLPKPILLLWETSEIQFAYCFKWDEGRTFFANNKYEGDKPFETGFNEVITPDVIVCSYVRTKGLKTGADIFTPHPSPTIND